ncbi:hypothetical protein HMPREF0758_2814 [Serratia odorifera DSM 4582]|uniref:Uncharacterized protein n=1 Tax=Serratia odorifera DSM 4582 TaxID=667129 RepID=D4E3R4_SEROD|nr:hypothetical protein HMPREF0758_2814 [Serratia odorifera DSM 4582]
MFHHYLINQTQCKELYGKSLRAGGKILIASAFIPDAIDYKI